MNKQKHKNEESISYRKADLQKRGESILYRKALVLNELAAKERTEGNHTDARRLLQSSLGIYEGLGDVQGHAASLHQLASIESAQGNPAEARRLLQRSLAMKEGLGDLQGQAASLHQLASIESAQGNPAEARRLWERSIVIEDQIGNVDGRASSLIMLAQLEGAGGNLDRALVMARESLRLLEGIGSAKAATAREILAHIERLGAGGSANVPPFLSELSDLLGQATAAGPEGGLAATDAALDAARRAAESSREVVALLARSVVLWNAGNVTGCDESLREAEEGLHRVGVADRTALTELVEQFKAQRSQANANEPSESHRLYTEAMEKAQAGDMAVAQGLFEASLAASRQKGDARGVAFNLLMSGQMLLALGQTAEARGRLREGLEVALELGDEALLKAMQAVATMAATMSEGAPTRGEQRGPERADDVLER